MEGCAQRLIPWHFCWTTAFQAPKEALRTRDTGLGPWRVKHQRAVPHIYRSRSLNPHSVSCRNRTGLSYFDAPDLYSLSISWSAVQGTENRLPRMKGAGLQQWGSHSTEVGGTSESLGEPFPDARVPLRQSEREPGQPCPDDVNAGPWCCWDLPSCSWRAWWGRTPPRATSFLS